MPPTLVDTNILARSAVLTDPKHPVVANALRVLRGGASALYVAAQNIVEFRSVATRAAGAPGNGLGLSAADADAEVDRIRQAFGFLPDVPGIYPEWDIIVRTHAVMGMRVYDARLVAVMKVHGISHILTFNGKDFAPYPDITVIDPATL